MSSRRLDWDRDGRDWPHRQHSRFVDRESVRWHVQTMGTGPAVLLVHGTGASTHSFRDLMPLLAERFTVVAPDLPGHAFSTTTSSFVPSLAGTATALADLLAALELAPLAVVGHSAGAAVLARMVLDGVMKPRLVVGLGAALVPFRGVGSALFAPFARLLAQSSWAAQFVAYSAKDSRSVERMLRSTGSSLDERGVDLYRRLVASPGHVEAVLAMMSHWNLDALFAELPKLPTRLLLLAGANDGATPVAQQREVARLVAGSRLVVVPAAGHLLHEEQPHEVARLIVDEIDSANKGAERLA